MTRLISNLWTVLAAVVYLLNYAQFLDQEFFFEHKVCFDERFFSEEVKTAYRTPFRKSRTFFSAFSALESRHQDGDAVVEELR